MNWERIERNWSEYKLNARTRWSRLSRDELDGIAGDRDKFVGKMCEVDPFR